MQIIADEDAAQIDDRIPTGWAGYWVDFGRDDAPGAALNVSTYPVRGERPGTFMVGVSYAYSIDGDDEWGYAGYPASSDQRVFHSAREADDAAWDKARAFATCAFALLMEVDPDIFSWDGQPFPVDDSGEN